MSKNEKLTKKVKNKDSEIVKELIDKNTELEEKYIRLQAEYVNFNNRVNIEKQNFLKYDGESFIREILSIKDDLERAILSDDDDLGDEVSKYLSGIKIIYSNLVMLLERYDVKEIECLGKEFDPKVAEAVLTEHNENKPENVVLEVLTKGYMYKDKLLRPAMVKVNI